MTKIKKKMQIIICNCGVGECLKHAYILMGMHPACPLRYMYVCGCRFCGHTGLPVSRGPEEGGIWQTGGHLGLW